MSDLNFKEKRYFEKIFEMGSGFVLDFSNRTMQGFIFDAIGVDIYSEKYSVKGESKANRLRGFWEIESNFQVGLLLEELLEYWFSHIYTGYDQDGYLHKECLKIVQRLKSGGPVENLDSIKPNTNEESFERLAASIKNSINNNQPEVGIDRLHTFVTRYIRVLSNKHGIEFEKDTPLHSLFGGYVKFLNASRFIESEMTNRILKSYTVHSAMNDIIGLNLL